MALIRNRVDLVLAAAMRDNPQLPLALSYDNCYVHNFGSYSTKKGFCQLKGRFGTGVRGKLMVKYQKLDVAVMLQNVRPWVYKTGATATLDLLSEINATFGFDLSANDIVDQPLIQGGSKAILEISNQSTLYCGKVTLYVGTGHLSLDSSVSLRNLAPELAYWPLQSRLDGCFLSLGHDYTAIAGLLLNVPVGTLSDADAAALAVNLASVDGVPWVATSQANYSLRQAKVRYNGLRTGVPTLYGPLVKELFNHILVFEVSSENTNLASSPIAIHYNVFM